MAEDGLKFVWGEFDDLTNRDLYATLQLRQNVFVLEQKCFYPDIDGLDPEAFHLQAQDRQSGALAGYLRVLWEDPDLARIGRVVVDPAFRRRGLSDSMLQVAIRRIRGEQPAATIMLSAQSYLIEMYARAGFQVTSEEYLEDGIPHTDMSLPPAT